MKKGFKKFRANNGETLAETLIAVLIISVVILGLAVSIVTASRINKQVQDVDYAFKGKTEAETAADIDVVVEGIPESTSKTIIRTYDTTQDDAGDESYTAGDALTADVAGADADINSDPAAEAGADADVNSDPAAEVMQIDGRTVSITYEDMDAGILEDGNGSIDDTDGTVTITVPKYVEQLDDEDRFKYVYYGDDTGGAEVLTEITVITRGGTFAYDGQSHGATVEVSGLPEGYTVSTAISNAQARHVSDGEVTAECDALIITDSENVDVTSDFSINYVDGSIRITARELTVTTQSAEKEYDGTALTAGGSYSGLVTGETLTFNVTGSQTEIGSSQNSYSISWNGSAAESDYSIKEDLGTLTVKENSANIIVRVTADTEGASLDGDGNIIYDGKTHGAKVVVEGLPEGYTVETAISNATATHVSEGAVTAKCDELVIKNSQGTDVTNKLSITKYDGTIRIVPLELTVSTASDEKVYDGEVLTAQGEGNTVTATVNGGTQTLEINDGTVSLPSGETVTLNITGSQKTVGESDNTYELKFSGEEGAGGASALSSDYTVTGTTGKLTVTEYAGEITVTTAADTKGASLDKDGNIIYDGQSHGAAVTVSKLPKGYSLKEAKSSAAAVNVSRNDDGSLKGVEARCDILEIQNAEGENVTSKLNIKYNNGTIVIAPKAVTVSPDTIDVESGRNCKTYGEKDPELSASVEGLVGTDTISYTLTRAAGEDAGDYVITASGSGTAGEDGEIQGNYIVTYNTGSYRILKAEALTITCAGYSGIYDGETHGPDAKAVDNRTGEIPEGTTISYSIDDGENWSESVPTISNTGNVTVKAKAVNSNYKDATCTYTLSISAKAVKVTVNNASKAYGDSDPSFSAAVEGTINGDEISYTISRSNSGVEAAGTYEGVLTASGDASQGNYEVTYVPGDFTITKSELTVTASGYSGIYDGAAHSGSVIVKDSKGNDLTYDSATSISYSTDGGTSWTSVAPTVKDADSLTVSVKAENPNYETGQGGYSISVNKRPVTITSGSASKDYDGTALTDDSVNDTLTGSTSKGFVTGEGAEYTVSGSQTVAGSSSNSFTYTLNSNTEAGNYEITKVEGELTVSPMTAEVTVTIKGNTGSKTYDGKEMTVSGYSVVSISDPLYTESDFSFSGIASVTGTDVNTDDAGNAVPYNMGLNVGQFQNTSSNFSNVKFVVTDGELTINPRTVVVTPDSDQNKIYGEDDPKELTYTLSEPLINGNSMTGALSRDTGENAGTYEINQGTLSAGSNYDIQFTSGIKFTINKKTVVVTPNSNQSKTYGDSDPTLTYEVSGLKSGDSLSGSLSREDGEDAGQYNILQGDLSAGNNYDIQFTSGVKFTVNKKQLNKPYASETEFDYDNTEHSLSVTGYDPGTMEQTGTVSETAVGDYEAKYSLKDTANYEWSDGTSDAVTINWKIKEVTVPLHYDANGGSGAPADQTMTFAAQTVISSAEPTRTGYKFMGWAASSTAAAAAYQPGGIYKAANVTPAEATLYAVWDKCATITYDANGGNLGDVPGTQIITKSQAAVLSSATPTRTKYYFLGWSTSSSAAAAAYQPGTTYKAAGADPSDVTLYAVWKSATIKISFNANGGSGSMSNMYVDENTTVNLPSCGFDAPSGKVFKCWNTAAGGGGTSYNEGATVLFEENTTLYAIWSNVYYVTLYPNYTGAAGSENSAALASGASYIVPGYPASLKVPDNKVFTSWNTKADGSGTKYTPGSAITISGNVSLYAQWASEYTVSYDANGGSGSVPSSSTVQAGSSVTVGNEEPTRQYYSFTGWNTAANGSGTTYLAGNTFIPTSDVTLYAQWELNEFVGVAKLYRGFLSTTYEWSYVGYSVDKNGTATPISGRGSGSSVAANRQFTFEDITFVMPAMSLGTTGSKYYYFTYGTDGTYTVSYKTSRTGNTKTVNMTSANTTLSDNSLDAAYNGYTIKKGSTTIGTVTP